MVVAGFSSRSCPLERMISIVFTVFVSQAAQVEDPHDAGSGLGGCPPLLHSKHLPQRPHPLPPRAGVCLVSHLPVILSCCTHTWVLVTLLKIMNYCLIFLIRFNDDLQPDMAAAAAGDGSLLPYHHCPRPPEVPAV